MNRRLLRRMQFQPKTTRSRSAIPMLNATGLREERIAASISRFSVCRATKRNALFALYAFMRLIDNVSDEPGDLEAKRRGLARWRGMLDEAISGDTSGHAILPALADSIARFKIPTRYFHDLILGAEMDLTVATYATFDQLSEYCYRVAGTVGLTCLHLFGFRDPRDPDLAERLGLAFQLTNIIRDVQSRSRNGPRLSAAGRSRTVRLHAERLARSAYASVCKRCSNSKRNAPGGFTKKASRSSAKSTPTAAPLCGRWCARTARCWRGWKSATSTCLLRAFRCRAPKKFNISSQRASR